MVAPLMGHQQLQQLIVGLVLRRKLAEEERA